MIRTLFFIFIYLFIFIFQNTFAAESTSLNIKNTQNLGLSNPSNSALSSFQPGYSNTTVNFLNWANYLPAETPVNFEKITGIKINQSFYDGADMLEAKLMAGNTGYDVIVPALVDMRDEIHFGLLQKLNKKWLPNYKYINPALYKLTASIDPNNNYGVIYQYGTTGIAYNPALLKQYLSPADYKKITQNNNNWDLLLSPYYLKKLSACGVSFLDSPTQVYGIVLHYLHLNPNSTQPKDYLRATHYLMSIRPYLTYFNNFKYQSDLASGNLCLAMVYSGDLLQAQSWADQSGNGVKLIYQMPKSGVPIWFDMLAIPTGAPNFRAAHAWINYLMTPKAIASVSNLLKQPNAIPASSPYLLPILKTSVATPNPETLKNAFCIHDIDPALKPLLSRLWFKVKYGE